VTTLDAYRQGGKSVRNWGRWGADGQLGTLNFIDAATLAQYLPGYGGPSEQQLVGIWETPFRWELYNGVSPSAITSRGATRLSIDAVDIKGILSRGVLRDVARHRGVENLPPNTAIAPGELDDVAAAEGIDVRSGDIVLVRTGWWPRFAELGDSTAWRAGCPGLSWSCAQWLHEHEVAAVAADNIALEAAERAIDGMYLPLHGLYLRDMGMMLGELWDLEALAADCAADGVYEFQLTALPAAARDRRRRQPDQPDRGPVRAAC
jgi:kynurenine formamidase